MANLGRKGDIYVARFRYQGKEYKKSLKTRDRRDAEAALKGIERTIHLLATGGGEVPAGVDPGDYIASCGTAREAPRARRRVSTLGELIKDYLENQAHKAPSTVYTEGVHLRNVAARLGHLVDAPADRIGHRHLEQYIQDRLGERSPTTVDKERVTLIQLFKWAVARGDLAASPAAGLAALKADAEADGFRTMAEIEATLARGGLDEAEAAAAWDCLYLSPPEIGELLRMVRARSEADFGYLLHAIPARTGMRRGEVLRLRWSDVDFEKGKVTARSRKQSRSTREATRPIDLHPDLRGELLDWRGLRPRGQYVVGVADDPGPLGGDRANRHFWQPLRGTHWCLNSRKNWFKVGFHTYRHSFASNLAARGVDQRIIDEWMGHQTEAMRKRYRHLHPSDRRSAIEGLSYA